MEWLGTREQNKFQFLRGVAIFPPFPTNQVKGAGLSLACGCLLVTADSVHSLPPNQAHQDGQSVGNRGIFVTAESRKELTVLEVCLVGHVRKSPKGLKEASYSPLLPRDVQSYKSCFYWKEKILYKYSTINKYSTVNKMLQYIFISAVCIH